MCTTAINDWTFDLQLMNCEFQCSINKFWMPAEQKCETLMNLMIMKFNFHIHFLSKLENQTIGLCSLSILNLKNNLVFTVWMFRIFVNKQITKNVLTFFYHSLISWNNLKNMTMNFIMLTFSCSWKFYVIEEC